MYDDSSPSDLQRFVATHLAGRAGQPLRIADVGSRRAGGGYRRLFEDPSWTYVGVDDAPGEHVDVVVDELHDWGAIAAESFDVVVCGRVFGQIDFFWLAVAEAARVLVPGGLLCLIAPSGGFGDDPVGRWRFAPEGLRALARYARLDVVDAYAEGDFPVQHATADPSGGHCVLVARKPRRSSRQDVPAAATGHDVESAAKAALPCYELERSTHKGEAAITHWTLDTPRSMVPYETVEPGRFRLRGWAIAEGDLPVRVALRYGGVTRCYPLDTARGDVVRKILLQEPDGHPKLGCGFDLSIEAVSELEFGFEVDARFTWMYTLRRHVVFEG